MPEINTVQDQDIVDDWVFERAREIVAFEQDDDLISKCERQLLAIMQARIELKHRFKILT